MSDVTSILSQIESGDPRAAEQLLPLVYEELRKLAAAKLAQEQPGQTLQPTALVHEAYLRLAGPGAKRDRGRLGDGETENNLHRPLADAPALPASPNPQPTSPPAWDSRGHFFAAAAEAMRRILVENARRKQCIKHGGHVERVELPDVPDDPDSVRLLELDEALTQLAAEDPLAARVVELRHFAGLGHERVSEALHITVYQARQKWIYARAWLQNALARE
jgi:ECF sigma factor